MKEITDVNKNIIPLHVTVFEAMKRLDEQIMKVLFIVNDNNQLVGSLTDGDIRRALLNNAGLDSTIDVVCHYNPVFVDEFTEDETIDSLMQELAINAIPMLNSQKEIIKIFYTGFSVPSRSNKVLETPVVIMAGGQGKRLYPYTKILPKPLIPIEDIPISQRIINQFMDSGCQKFYMVVNYKKNMIKAYYQDSTLIEELGTEVEFVEEEKPLGTGGGLKLLEKSLDKFFILTNCDILVLEDIEKIVNHHKTSGNAVTIVCSLKEFEIPYGIVNFSEGGVVSSFEEKPKMRFYTNTGYYVLEPEVFKYIGDDEVIGMPDIIERMKEDGLKVGVYPIGDNKWLDMGQFDSMEGMERRLRELM